MVLELTFEAMTKDMKPVCVVAPASWPRSLISRASTGLATVPTTKLTGVFVASHDASSNVRAVHVSPSVPFTGTSTPAVASVEMSWVTEV